MSLIWQANLVAFYFRLSGINKDSPLHRGDDLKSERVLVCSTMTKKRTLTEGGVGACPSCLHPMTAAHQPSPGRLVTWLAGLWTAAPINSKPVGRRSTWEDATSALPVEVYEHIFSFLEPQTLVTILRVCNQLHQVAARFLFARVALNSTVSFDHILALFSGVLPQPQYGTHVRTFLIDLAAERERSAPPGVLQPLQPFLVDMFAGGFRSLKHLRVLSLPLKLSEAFAAIYDLHFPQLERLDVRCAVPMEDLVAFVSRHAASLTHLVHPHHIAAEALESLAVLPRLMYLHATPSLVLHVLENQPEVRLQYLGILCSPPVPWGGPTRTDDDVAECLPTILDVLRTWDENPLNTLHIHEPFGFSHIRSAVARTGCTVNDTQSSGTCLPTNLLTSLVCAQEYSGTSYVRYQI